MSDGQGEPLEQPELLSVAEVLTEHAEATIRAAWLKQAARQHLEIPESYVHVANVEEAFTAGWRAALEWYIGLSTGRQLGELLESARQLGYAEAGADTFTGTEQEWQQAVERAVERWESRTAEVGLAEWQAAMKRRAGS